MEGINMRFSSTLSLPWLLDLNLEQVLISESLYYSAHDTAHRHYLRESITTSTGAIFAPIS
jgi:hypothetical protein